MRTTGTGIIKCSKDKSIHLDNVYDGVIKAHDGTYIYFNANEQLHVKEFYSNPANKLDEHIENERISDRHMFYKRLVDIVNKFSRKG
ncbi:hypothetical protein LKI_01830 [Leuconostoc kimchii IMSNU 11154]|uniref:Uncharacterized protein n=1 Tax=Leuconostoc kimchii (strain IMSNU 11154 / KCTC 2386 / IH25) TaxID=762051 RepID=D5T0W0_LEUKI|nr:hypothetical protein [Leuconostoc kimchii]ADG39909.1 hypothetical protein LKI_01830 [Leuconostoc kimchii IMSNU 11154]